MKKRRSLVEINADMDRINKRKPSKEQIRELTELFQKLYFDDNDNQLKTHDNKRAVKSDSYVKKDKE